MLHLIDVAESNRVDFSHMDKILDRLYYYDLTPGFEIMGNPGGLLTDLNNKEEQVFLFKTIKMLKARYLKR